MISTVTVDLFLYHKRSRRVRSAKSQRTLFYNICTLLEYSSPFIWKWAWNSKIRRDCLRKTKTHCRIIWFVFKVALQVPCHCPPLRLATLLPGPPQPQGLSRLVTVLSGRDRLVNHRSLSAGHRTTARKSGILSLATEHEGGVSQCWLKVK